MPKPLPGYLRYPGDYSQTPQFMCSLAAQGLWMLLEDVMHSSERYGYLQFQGKPMADEMIVRRCGGIPLEDFRKAFDELERMGCITRERQSRVVYSENLVAQDVKRAGGRERVNRHRHGDDKADAKPEQKSEQSGADLRGKVREAAGRKSLEVQDDCNAGVTSYPRARVGLASASGFVLDSLQETPEASGQPTTRGQASENRPGKNLPAAPSSVLGSGLVETASLTLAPLAPPIPADVLASADARGAMLAGGDDETWGMVDLVVEIALASPAGVGNKWTPLSVEQDRGVTEPIWDAIRLEQQEHGLSERESALWLLKQVRDITGRVREESGWIRFWTQARQGRFFRSVEYRVIEKFGVQGGGNGATSASSKASRRGSAAERNEEARQRLLGSTSQPPAGGGNGSAGPGRPAEPGPVEAGRAGSVHSGARGLHGGAVPNGNRNSYRAMPVLSGPGGVARIRIPR